MRIRSRTLTKLVGWTGSAAFKALARTLTFECRTESGDFTPVDQPACLYCLWHDAILIPLATKVVVEPTRSIAALVSRHQDGSYLASFMDGLGIKSIRGSTQRGGDQALRTLLRDEQSHIYITPDGPRGPRREIKPGILFLAAQTGRPIVPIGCAGSSGWRFQGSWTDLYVPKPLSRVVHYLGAPLWVPENVSRNGLELFATQLADGMKSAQEKAERLLRGESIVAQAWRKAA